LVLLLGREMEDLFSGEFVAQVILWEKRDGRVLFLWVDEGNLIEG